MVIDITKSPDLTYKLLPCLPEFTVSLKESFEKRSEGERLTNDTALKILKNIERSSTTKAFISSPIVYFPVSVLILSIGLLLPPAGFIMTALGIILSGIGGGLLGYSIQNTFNEFLPALSEAFSEQAKLAREYIDEIRASDHESEFALA